MRMIYSIYGSYYREPIKGSIYFSGEEPKWQGSRAGDTRKQKKRTKIRKKNGCRRGRIR